MDEYRCGELDVPAILYRVNYLSSKTSFSDKQGLTAADQNPMPKAMDLSRFKETVEQHFTWHSEKLSPFISLFSDRKHTENWLSRSLGGVRGL